MRVTLQQVEELRKRVNCDYQTAEKALRKSKGSIDGAVLYLKKAENKRYKKIIVTIQEIVSKILSYNIVVFKNDRKVGYLPIVVILLGIWILNIPLPIVLAIGVLAALSDFSFELVEKSHEDADEDVVKTTKDAVKETVKETTMDTVKDTTKSEKQQAPVEPVVLSNKPAEKDDSREEIYEEKVEEKVEEPIYDDNEYNEIIIE